jgi:hypothetical protein
LLDETEGAAIEEHGHRPISLVTFNNHTIGVESLDHHRDLMLAEDRANPKKIQREYRRAKKALADLERGGPEWDERAGIAELRADCETACQSEQDAFLALLTGKPTTGAGIAALLRYLHGWNEDTGTAWLEEWIDPFSTAGAGFMLVLADAIDAVSAKAVQS